MSNPDSVAETEISTKGMPSTVCAMIRPVKVPTRSKREKAKNMPAAMMMTGTIIGDSMIAMISRRAGI